MDSIELSMKQKVVTVTITVIAVVVLLAVKFSTDASNIINGGIFIATSALVAVAYFQLDALAVQNNATFLLTFNREFFDKEYNQKIIETIEDKTPLLADRMGKFTEYQVDDFLGYFELMSLFEKKGAIDFESIYEMFGHYITLAWEHPEVSTYIQNLREEHQDDTYYEHFENLASRVKEEDIKRKSKGNKR